MLPVLQTACCGVRRLWCAACSAAAQASVRVLGRPHGVGVGGLLRGAGGWPAAGAAVRQTRWCRACTRVIMISCSH